MKDEEQPIQTPSELMRETEEMIKCLVDGVLRLTSEQRRQAILCLKCAEENQERHH